jgi:hypothetical protein
MTRKTLQTSSATVSNTAVEIDAATWSWENGMLETAKRAVISTNQDIMIRWDGTAPTTTVGHPILANQWAAVEHPGDIADLSFIRKGASNATVTVTLER